MMAGHGSVGHSQGLGSMKRRAGLGAHGALRGRSLRAERLRARRGARESIVEMIGQADRRVTEGLGVSPITSTCWADRSIASMDRLRPAAHTSSRSVEATIFPSTSSSPALLSEMATSAGRSFSIRWSTAARQSAHSVYSRLRSRCRRHIRDRTGRLGERDEPPIALVREALERREPVRRMRVADQHDRGRRIFAAVHAVVWLRLAPLGVAGIGIDHGDRRGPSRAAAPGRPAPARPVWRRWSARRAASCSACRSRRVLTWRPPSPPGARRQVEYDRARTVGGQDGGATALPAPSDTVATSRLSAPAVTRTREAGNPRDRAVTDRLLDPAPAGLGEHEGQPDERRARRPREGRADGGRRQHEEGPVPEVERIRDAADPAHRPDGQQPRQRAERLSEAAPDDQRRADDGHERGRARERRIEVEQRPPRTPIRPSRRQRPRSWRHGPRDAGHAASRQRQPAPSASSQARAGSRKNASGASVEVQLIDSANEATATIATATAIRRRLVERPATISSSAGQKR